jgi:hypothetical protein
MATIIGVVFGLFVMTVIVITARMAEAGRI